MLQVLSCEKVGFKKSKGKYIASGAKNKRYGFVDCVFTLTLKLFVLSAMRKVRLFTGKEKMSAATYCPKYRLYYFLGNKCNKIRLHKIISREKFARFCLKLVWLPKLGRVTSEQRINKHSKTPHNNIPNTNIDRKNHYSFKYFKNYLKFQTVNK